MDFPSLKSGQLESILFRKPLSYEVVRQSGSHKTLESSNGYPPLGFSWHDGVDLPPGLVRKVLTKDVGLSNADALAAIRGKLK